eukprot:CAMPEP_0185800232 /NCGR_PEP_ID=MMETSP1322-20130828/774_1 /TAXON_ID=265543 /ORGANISM="Minutocellus polymorphus, Strain RCC2270" /LENGTH=261 /DNA_ID=CAMNT_0028495873 /DNA_START=97 /DNA_END=882 /DNA_ORIENTATION=+
MGERPPRPAARQHRVSFEVGPDDHPLLVLRKRMKTGDTRHTRPSFCTYGKSESVLMNDPEAKERLRRIMDVAKGDDTLLTPRGETGVTLSPLRTPPTPGRHHDITWDQEAPMFFPLRLAVSPVPSPAPKRKSDSDDDVSPFSSQNLPSRNVNLRPRFECPWIIEKLGLPNLSDGVEDCRDHDLPIPFAPFTSDDSEGDEGYVDKKPKQVTPSSSPNTPSTTATSSPVASASAKLSGMSLSVSAAAERSNINRRKSVNARTA